MLDKETDKANDLMDLSSGLQTVVSSSAHILELRVHVTDSYIRKLVFSALKGFPKMLMVARAQRWKGGIQGLFSVLKRAEDDALKEERRATLTCSQGLTIGERRLTTPVWLRKCPGVILPMRLRPRR